MSAPEEQQRDFLAALMEGSGVTDAELFPPRPRWMADALCREYPDVNFYPTLGESAEPAKAICRNCSVREECLAYGVDHVERGVWGGTTERERSRMRGGSSRRGNWHAGGRTPGKVPHAGAS